MIEDIESHSTELEPYHRAVINAVLAAGQQLVAMQPNVSSSRVLTMKEDGTIVTAADLVSEEILLRAIDLHAPRPYWIVSEERVQAPKSDDTDLTWFVDPLDGTRSYAAGSPDFAVLVSVWSGAQPIFSVVHYPAAGQIAVAAGLRAARMPPDTPAGADSLQSGTLYACYLRSPMLRRIAEEAGTSIYSEDEAESTRALLDVATGAASGAVVLLCGHKSWDLAAPLHLIVARGGYVSDETGRPIQMRGSDVSGRYVIAARDRPLHARLVDASQHFGAMN